MMEANISIHKSISDSPLLSLSGTECFRQGKDRTFGNTIVYEPILHSSFRFIIAAG